MFDIDGTLVDSNAFDGPLFAEAFRTELDVIVDQTWQSYQHVTDSGILDEVLRTSGADLEYSNAYERVKARFIELVQNYISNQPDGLKPIPGAPELIHTLRLHPGVTTAFATGGWRETAEAKLRSAGIAFEDTPFATASDAISRTAIMRLAEQRALSATRFTNRTYFGDGPWDKAASAQLGYDFVAIGGCVQHACAFEDFTKQDAILSVLGI